MSCIGMTSTILSEEPKLSLLPSRSASHASTASFTSSQGDGEGRISRIVTRQHQQSRVFGTPTKKAKRVRFFRNGDRFFKGVVMPVTPERYRSFDSLLADVTRSLKDHVTLPNGVRNLYTTDGTKVASVDDLEDGKGYVCSGQGEQFKKIEYINLSSRKEKNMKVASKLFTGRESISVASSADSARSMKVCDVIRPRVVTLVRNGVKPRRLVRMLLNKRNAPSFEHALSSITDTVKLDTGAVRKVFTTNGSQILNLHDLFNSGDLFFVYGSERVSPDDFQLDSEEMKQMCKKGVSWSRRARDELSSSRALPMPKLSRKKVPVTTETREPDLDLPSQVRLKYKVEGIVGDGNFAVVRRCIDRRKGGEYAMKIIDKSKCKGREQMIENEVEILRKVRHPNIIRLLAEFDTPNELYLIMELEEGDLFDAIAESTKFPEDEARLMITHLAAALAYLHKRNIVHRDIKPENLLVRFDENRKLRSLRLGDFGLAQHVTWPLSAICGTPTYVAPEILCEVGYGLKVDIWAAGVILYILLCGFPPFVSRSDDQEELFDKILVGAFEFTPPYWSAISSEAKDLITCMLQGSPDVRFSAEDVLDHPWLQSMVEAAGLSGTTVLLQGPSNETNLESQMLNEVREDTVNSPPEENGSPARRLKPPNDLQNMDFSG